MVFDRGTLGILSLTYFYIPKSAGAYLFPQSFNIQYFCDGPIIVDPFARNQVLQTWMSHSLSLSHSLTLSLSLPLSLSLSRWNLLLQRWIGSPVLAVLNAESQGLFWTSEFLLAFDGHSVVQATSVLCVYLYISLSIYIYIYRERERETEISCPIEFINIRPYI